MSALPLILLKTKSYPKDPYAELFSNKSFTNATTPNNPIFVPVLNHNPTNLSELEALLRDSQVRGDATPSKYSGVIITSQRSVEALGSVLDKLIPDHDLAPLLQHTKVYVVGPATAKAVVDLGFAEENVLGKECGSGAILGPYIVANYDASSGPLLFLVGETRSDVIQSHLKDNGVVCKEMVVYETSVAEGFREEFGKVMEETRGGVRWVVVFSPTGADVARDVLRGFGEEKGEERTYWAAIGPTTETHLKKLGRRPDVVAKAPSPTGLWTALDEFMGKL